MTRDVDAARADLRIGQRRVDEVAALDRDHPPSHAVADEIDGHVREGDRDGLIERVRVATAQVVRQLARDRLMAGAVADDIGQDLRDVRLPPVPEGIGHAVLRDRSALPHRALGRDDQRVARRVAPLVLVHELHQPVEVEWRFGDEAAGRCDVGRVQRGEAGVATEDPEHADALMRPERRALSIDELLRARDGRGEADAVLGPLNVVVHRLRHSHEAHPFAHEDLGERERVVATDRHEPIEAERLDVPQDQRSQVVDAVADGEARSLRGIEMHGQPRLLQLLRIRARGVEDRAAGAVDGPRVLTIQRPDVLGVGLGAGPHMRETFPSATDAEHLVAELRRAVDHALDHGIEAGDVAAAREDADAALHARMLGAPALAEETNERIVHQLWHVVLDPMARLGHVLGPRRGRPL